MKGVRIVRAVIVGESKLLRSSRLSDECLPVPLSSGRHRLVAGSDECADRGRSGQNRSEHGRIVSRIEQLADRVVGRLKNGGAPA